MDSARAIQDAVLAVEVIVKVSYMCGWPILMMVGMLISVVKFFKGGK